MDPVWIVSMHACMCVCVYVCPHPRILITSGVIWHDIDEFERSSQLAVSKVISVTPKLITNIN